MMLIEFLVKNFKCFKEEAALSFVSGKGKAHPRHVVEQGGMNLLRSAVFFGANGSGKTSFIEACQHFCNMLANSPNLVETAAIPFPCFALDPDASLKPIEFETSFILDDIVYQYGFSYLQSEIQDEYLFATPADGRQQLWFERTKNEIKTGRNLKGKKSFKPNSNQLYLSLAKDNIQLDKVYEFFKRWRFIYNSEEAHRLTCQLIHENVGNVNFKKLVDSIFKNIDIGIDSVLVTKKSIEDLKLDDNIPDAIKSQIERDIKANGFYEVSFKHNSSYSGNPIHFQQESKGTQATFNMLGPIINGMLNDSVMFFDEFNHHLHPALSVKLIELLNNSFKKDSYQSQYVLNVLDTNILDPDVLRYDQIWFTDKDSSTGSSELYSLAEFKLRSDNYSKNYLDGKYGAVPIIKKFGIDLSESKVVVEKSSKASPKAVVEKTSNAS